MFLHDDPARWAQWAGPDKELGRWPGMHRDHHRSSMGQTQMKPPKQIDGARVIEWAWSGSKPFGEVPGAEPPEIFGLAIATYDDIQFYRFSCDRNWNTVQDGVYDSVAEAKERLPEQYRGAEATWHSFFERTPLNEEPDK